MIKEVLNKFMRKKIKEPDEREICQPVEEVVNPVPCSCTNLAQDGGKTYCKDCGDVK